MEGGCFLYQLFLLSRCHGSQLFIKILFLFLLQLFSQTGHGLGHDQGAGPGMKGSGSQLFYDGLV